MKGTQKLFALLTLLVLAFGFLPLLAQRLPYQGLDWLAYEPVVYYGDSNEPDDSRFTARPCLVGGSFQLHNLHAEGDQDWIFLATEAGGQYTVETRARPLGSLADTVLEVFDSNGQPVAANDDGGGATDAVVEFQATYTGIYYARVTEWADRYGTAYWYQLGCAGAGEPIYRRYLPLIVRGYR